MPQIGYIYVHNGWVNQSTLQQDKFPRVFILAIWQSGGKKDAKLNSTNIPNSLLS